MHDFMWGSISDHVKAHASVYCFTEVLSCGKRAKRSRQSVQAVELKDVSSAVSDHMK